ncbi:MAG TPA: 16S rRNA (adenine(1518)-N(6)/adenine(1519)-N(6))-dimethyltransferase RsmA [bacterium]|nr:16S rRNA (adenine(1518)-N(6)/adenine(1519)-N(6))-dimethyltransferase RsmA [bacterium]
MTAQPPVEAKKSLGQNWLTDQNIARKLLDALAPVAGETVLEIGPGGGALTQPLLARTDKVIAVEIDGRLLDHLRETFSERIELIHADILDIDLTELAARCGGSLVVLGNLPYYASSPILFHLLSHRTALSRAVLTLQKEVVERCIAGPGTKDYGSLAVQLTLAAKVKRLFTISPNVFRPRPGVESAAMLVDFTAPHPRQPRDPALLEKVVRAAFGRRRKTLRNALAAELGEDTAAYLLEALAENPMIRAEQLSVEQFVDLADALAARGQ